MTSLKQIEANRLNALKSTGPRTEQGKQRSRRNAIVHGLTAETVITALESAEDYQAFEASIIADYHARSTTELELVLRLASVLWRLRRSTSIETGLFQMQSEMIRNRDVGLRPRRNIPPPPDWYDELDSASAAAGYSSPEPRDTSQSLASCFLQVSRLGYGAFELLSRYETALWRQAAQILFILQAAGRR